GKDFQWDEHITERYGAYLKKLGIEDYGTGYDVFLDSERERRAEEFIGKIREKHPEKKISVVNPYGASKHRSLNFENLKNIIKLLKKRGYITIFIYSPDKKSELETFIRENRIEEVVLAEEIKSILDSASLLKFADLVITPDTSIVHIASAYDKRMISIYPPRGGKYFVDHLVWGPQDTKNKIIFCQDKKSEKDEIDINSFSMEDMESEMNKII
ncbi:MAG: glycosyltransferase family 9 protein, partial [Cetobacterium sp.]